MATWQVPFLNLKIKMHTPHQCSTGGTLFEDDYHQLYSPVICAGGARRKDSTVQQTVQAVQSTSNHCLVFVQIFNRARIQKVLSASWHSLNAKTVFR